MLRSGATRAFARSINASPIASTSRLAASSRSLMTRRPQCLGVAAFKPITTSLQRYATATEVRMDTINLKKEAQLAKEKLEASPEDVSLGSSVRHVREMGQEDKDTDMLAGVKADLKTIRETFVLTEVPREAYNIGLAGVLPYLATSLSTVFLSWDINHAHHTGSGILFDGKTAETLLHIIEPIQVGYGAVIISFLGAIHWGLEWAQYGGVKGYRRYAIGVVAPAIAWPTMLMPVEYALITQFLAFNFLYYVDARATVKGWTPPWYTTYRFVLTFVVGASIVLSLIGRGQIADKVGSTHGPTERLMALKDGQWEQLEKEERERQKALALSEEAAGDEDEAEEEDDE